MDGISWPTQVGQGSQTARDSHPSCYASVGLEATVTGIGGCPDPLLRSGHASRRYITPAQNHASIVVRFPRSE